METQTTEQQPIEIKPWQKGYELGFLKSITAIFEKEFKPFVFGAFGCPDEVLVADELSKNAVVHGDDVAMIYHLKAKHGRVEDFAGNEVLISQNSIYVKHLAGGGAKKALEDIVAMGAPVWCEIFIENKNHLALMDELNFDYVLTKISAASELKGVFYLGKQRSLPGLMPIDQITLAEISKLNLPDVSFQWIKSEFDSYMQQHKAADHYSSYNKGKSWSAFALRGFDADPLFIQKPAEMSQKWKKENASKLSAECLLTMAAIDFPQTLKILNDVLQCEKERVRFMILKPGGGELARHADITDRNAGTKLGNIVRIHFPIYTNEKILFEGWNAYGRKIQFHMKQQTANYLDTRKPHRVENNSETERVHLVVDCIVNEYIKSALHAAATV